MDWLNPAEITARLWPVKYGRVLVTVDWLLCGLLVLGMAVLAADKAVNEANAKASLPLLAKITGWRYFGHAVLILVLTAVPLGAGLAFWSAKTGAKIAIESGTPSEYEVETPSPNQPNVNVNAPNNQGVVIGSNQGQVNIQQTRVPKLSLSSWTVTRRADGSYQSQATLISDIPAVLPRVTFIANSPTLVSLRVSPSAGVGFGVVEGSVNEGRFVSFANVTPPYVITVITREKEEVKLQLSDWNPLGG